MAGFQNRSKTSFYAAEAAAAEGRALVRQVGSWWDQPTLSPRPLGDMALYDREMALPSYSGDPAFTPAIRRLDVHGGPSGGMDLRIGGQAFVDTLWRINVQGQSPDGSTSRIEVVETKTLAIGY